MFRILIFSTALLLCFNNVLSECIESTLQPHPYDCSKFQICEHGVFTDMDCPDSLHFNPNELWCDWPSEANCVEQTPAPAPTTTTPEPAPETTSQLATNPVPTFTTTTTRRTTTTTQAPITPPPPPQTTTTTERPTTTPEEPITEEPTTKAPITPPSPSPTQTTTRRTRRTTTPTPATTRRTRRTTTTTTEEPTTTTTEATTRRTRRTTTPTPSTTRRTRRTTTTTPATTRRTRRTTTTTEEPTTTTTEATTRRTRRTTTPTPSTTRRTRRTTTTTPAPTTRTRRTTTPTPATTRRTRRTTTTTVAPTRRTRRTTTTTPVPTTRTRRTTTTTVAPTRRTRRTTTTTLPPTTRTRRTTSAPLLTTLLPVPSSGDEYDYIFGDVIHNCRRQYDTTFDYNYTTFYSIYDVADRVSNGTIEFKVLVQANEDARILLSPTMDIQNLSKYPYEIVLGESKEKFAIRQNDSKLEEIKRKNLLSENRWTPVIVRWGRETIEIQIEGERSPFLVAKHKNPIDIYYISFSTKGSKTQSKWQFDCPIRRNPEPQCQQYNSTSAQINYLRFWDINEIDHNRPNREIELNLWIIASNDSRILLSSVPQSPTAANSGNPHYEIVLGAENNRAYEINRNTHNLERSTKNNVLTPNERVSVVITIDMKGSIKVEVGGSKGTSFKAKDDNLVDVRFISFRSSNSTATATQWFFDC